MIGPYKLLAPLGEGGFGTVFLAAQETPVRRKVALKILKPGMDSRQIVARFEAERQALAIMDHPHIAKVFDGGATPAGRPYFVMELVQGIPLTDFCDQHHLALTQRLELFLAVCQAVQHAHQKGIIHRDLKPSNVLVAQAAGTPLVKVIDFGVAKALGQELTDKTLVTGLLQLIGTPLYMSPEQAGRSAPDIDTRSDIYALGVLLYELLTGATPFDRERFRLAPYDEICRIIREEEPPKPSTRLLCAKETLPTVAAQRQMEPTKLIRSIRGELDWIVLKCLEKDRNRRYETASSLAEDVQRYLAEEAVQAGPPTTAYRLRKFLWRHKRAVVAGALLLLSLLGGLTGTIFGLVEAQRQEQRARAAAVDEKKAREAASAAEADTQAFARFLADHVLATTRPEGWQGGIGYNVTMEEALIRAEPMVPVVFRNRPRAEALTRQEIGVTWRNLGKYPQAERHLRRALQLRREYWGVDDVETLLCQNSLAVTLCQAGRTDEAVTLHEQVLKALQLKCGSEAQETLIVQSNLASAYERAGQLDRAVPLYETVLAKQRATLGPAHADTLGTQHDLAHAYRALGQFEKAVFLLEATLEKQRTMLGADHADALVTAHTLGNAYRDVGQIDRAVRLLETTREKQRERFGPMHPATLNTAGDLALTYWEAGQTERAVALGEQTWAQRKTVLGLDHPDTYISANNLASMYREGGKLDRAVPLFEQTLERRQAILGAAHPDTLNTMNNLAFAYLTTGKPDRALQLFQTAATVMRQKHGAGHPRTLAFLGNLCVCYELLRQPAQAEPLRRELVDGARQKFGAHSTPYAIQLANLGINLLHQKKYAQGENLLRDALAISSQRTPNGWGTHHLRSLLGSALVHQKKYAAAEPYLLQGYAGLKETKTPPEVKRLRAEALEAWSSFTKPGANRRRQRAGGRSWLPPSRRTAATSNQDPNRSRTNAASGALIPDE